MSEWSALLPLTWPCSPLPEKRDRRPPFWYLPVGRRQDCTPRGAQEGESRGWRFRPTHSHRDHNRRKCARCPTGWNCQDSRLAHACGSSVVSPSSIKESFVIEVRTDGPPSTRESHGHPKPHDLPPLPCPCTQPQRTLNQCWVLKVAKACRQAGLPNIFSVSPTPGT